LKIVFATDAWHPQVNGVVRSLSTTIDHLRRSGHEIEVIEPSRFRTIACPTYPEIPLAIGCGRAVARLLDAARPDSIHISTEGPIGWATRSWCLKHGSHFTTAFHTRFPDYVSIRTGIPVEWMWKLMRRFHGAADRTFTATASLAEEVQEHGIERTHHWPLGVDLLQFNPHTLPHAAIRHLPRPILLNVGRVAVEKNIEAFLGLDVPGSKVIVGGGPALEKLRARYKDALFLGPKSGAELASAYATADVLVFPSRTDTFGLVNIEALACGLPVAAYPVAGPLDILGPTGRGVHGGKWRIGACDENLGSAIEQALRADRHAAVREAQYYSWELCTERFVAGLSRSSTGAVHLPSAGWHRRKAKWLEAFSSA
jgi:glycosyltransferase involved in cell wall biosynthesis